uniref:Putative secreted protein n=1 Tax=Amblyomma triste TaxID=251400 RepID=A0A023G0N9_AMBTT
MVILKLWIVVWCTGATSGKSALPFNAFEKNPVQSLTLFPSIPAGETVWCRRDHCSDRPHSAVSPCLLNSH